MKKFSVDIIDKYNTVGDDFVGDDSIVPFLNGCFGIKRAIVIKSDNNKRYIKNHLKHYCADNSIQIHFIDAKKALVDTIRGKIEIIQNRGLPEHKRILPEYIKESKNMIVVENINKDANLDMLKAFTYMACLDSWYDDVKNLPKDKLPYGSSYVFLDNNDFPYDKLSSITSYWNDEMVIYDARNFVERVKEHMENYKESILCIEEKGVYSHQGREIEYGHILPKSDKWKNILPFKNYEVNNIISDDKLHKYFHHLNSSQGMCLNFFYPLIKEKRLDIILKALRIKGDICYKAFEFEKESEIDNGYGRSTNFDFYLSMIDGKRIYFEIKYTENEFGKAKNDQEHQKKYNEIYKPLLMNNKAINNKYKEQDIFLENYQILRNLVHIDEKSTVVFIYPKGNKGIREGAKKAKNEIVVDEWNEHFIPITWEGIVEELISHIADIDLQEYYQTKFTKKYLNI